MGWLRVESALPQHKKVHRAASRLGPQGIGRVLSVWLAGACYAVDQLTDGFVPITTIEDVRIDRRPREVIEAMVAVGLLEPVDGGYLFHDFGDYNPSGDAVEVYRQQKAAAGRLGGIKSAATRQARREAQRQARAQADASIEIPKPEPPAQAPAQAKPKPDPDPPHPLRTERSEGERAREVELTQSAAPPLIDGHDQRRHGLHAWCDYERGMCVPLGLHTQFVKRLGTPDADARLKAWYPAFVASFAGRVIGDPLFRFWDHGFAQEFGTVTAPPAGREQPRPHDGNLRYDWRAECEALHGGTCGNMNFHVAKRDAALEGARS